jgi:hypothetical protein
MTSVGKCVIGIDFDNTIVCYDQIFYQVALERGLIPAAICASKESVRDYFRGEGKEDLWTELQGDVYGSRMSNVPAFPGALECIARWHAGGIPVFIISHKSRYPYRGKAHDLHAAARKWLEDNGMFDPGIVGISTRDVFLKETKDEKLNQISQCGCTHFIDDLPELFAEPSFPPNTKKLLFSPGRTVRDHLDKDVLSFRSWRELDEFFFRQ